MNRIEELLKIKQANLNLIGRDARMTGDNAVFRILAVLILPVSAVSFEAHDTFVEGANHDVYVIMAYGGLNPQFKTTINEFQNKYTLL